MDVVTEEVITSLIRRIEKLENKVKTRIPQTRPRYASKNQIRYYEKLGGEPWEGITHKEISKEIDKLLKNELRESEEVEKAINKGLKQKELDNQKSLTKEQKEELPDY